MSEQGRAAWMDLLAAFVLRRMSLALAIAITSLDYDGRLRWLFCRMRWCSCGI